MHAHRAPNTEPLLPWHRRFYELKSEQKRRTGKKKSIASLSQPRFHSSPSPPFLPHPPPLQLLEKWPSVPSHPARRPLASLSPPLLAGVRLSLLLLLLLPSFLLSSGVSTAAAAVALPPSSRRRLVRNFVFSFAGFFDAFRSQRQSLRGLVEYIDTREKGKEQQRRLAVSSSRRCISMMVR